MGEGKKGARPGTRGTTNNPGGRPAEALMEREKWRKYGAEARKKAVNLMRHGSTEQIQLNAAKLIIERAWGARSRMSRLGARRHPARWSSSINAKPRPKSTFSRQLGSSMFRPVTPQTDMHPHWSTTWEPIGRAGQRISESVNSSSDRSQDSTSQDPVAAPERSPAPSER
jgi:hypothetical protein